MPAKFLKVLFLVIFAFAGSGCTHYAPFPESENHDIASISENTVSESASSKEKNKVEAATQKIDKKAKSKSAVQEKQGEDQKLLSKEEKKHVSKDLTKPNPEIDDIIPSDTSYNVIGKSTPAVLTDIDLTEMDAEENTVKIIEPVSETKTILATKKVQKVLPAKLIKKVSSSPSVFYLAETVYFNNGSASVDSKYWGKLKKIVKEAKAHNGMVIVQGFASSRTRNTDMVSHKLANLKVSVKRADNVADVLVKYGMPRSHIITEGLSDSRPAYQEVMPEGERLNRRAEIYVRY